MCRYLHITFSVIQVYSNFMYFYYVTLFFPKVIELHKSKLLTFIDFYSFTHLQTIIYMTVCQWVKNIDKGYIDHASYKKMKSS
jgi:hypothetical protein